MHINSILLIINVNELVSSSIASIEPAYDWQRLGPTRIVV